MKSRQTKAVVRDVPAASRAISILRLLGKSTRPLSLSEIAGQLELVPSTCLHILRVLVDETLVSTDKETKRYSLGVGILPLARQALRQHTPVSLIRPEIDVLSRRYGVSAILSRFGGKHIIVVAVSNPSEALSLKVEIGSRYPLELSATGRCFAAFGGVSPEIMASELGKYRWANKPKRSVWLAEVAACRAAGYAVDRGNYIAGVTVIAAPVFDNQRHLTHSVGVVSISEVADKIGMPVLGRALIDIANRASVSEA